MRPFTPDYLLDNLSAVTPAFLREIGVRFLFMDIDNTIEPYENPEPTPASLAWFASMKEAGVTVAFISNNNAGRVELFNRGLGYLWFSSAAKPFPKYIKKAMKSLGAEKENSLFVGDQIFTDTLAGHLAGMRTVLVPPIKDKTDLLTKTKRLLEKPILKRMKRKTLR